MMMWWYDFNHKAFVWYPKNLESKKAELMILWILHLESLFESYTFEILGSWVIVIAKIVICNWQTDGQKIIELEISDRLAVSFSPKP